MSAHPAPRATRAIKAETAGSSGLALGPNQRGKGGGEVEASIPFMAMAHQRTRGRVRPRAWRNLAATAGTASPFSSPDHHHHEDDVGPVFQRADVGDGVGLADDEVGLWHITNGATRRASQREADAPPDRDAVAG